MMSPHVNLVQSYESNDQPYLLSMRASLTKALNTLDTQEEEYNKIFMGKFQTILISQF